MPDGSEGGEAPAGAVGRGRSLGSRAVRGGFTVVAGQVARIALQVVSVSVLARLLTPTDYGLTAIVLSIVGVGEIFRDFGLSTAAIRAKSVTDAQRDKLFWANTGIGAALTVLCIVCAPLVAIIFHQPALTGIAQAMAFVFLLNGMAAQHEADLTRQLRFGALAAVSIGSQIIGTAAAIVSAALGAGYWALVLQQLVAAVVTVVWQVALTRWIPRLPKRDVEIGSFVRFGVGLVGSQIIGYLNNNVDTFTIGLRYPVAQLGLYNRGYQLLMRPLGQLRSPTTSVALPTLARVSDDPDRTDAFLVTGQLALGYTLVAGTALAAGASRPIVDVFLGPGWGAVAPVFGLLAIAGMLQTISFVGFWVYLSRGLTAKLAGYSLVSLAIKIVCVLVGSTWGIIGVAAGFAVATGLAWPISIWWLGRLTRIPVGALYRGAARILCCSGISAGASFVVSQLSTGLPSLLALILATAAGVAVYAPMALVPTIRADLVTLYRQAKSGAWRRK